MQQYKTNKLNIVFWIFSFLDISAITCNAGLLHYTVKPLLVPVLMLLLYFTSPGIPGKKILLAGLFFSWLGDVFLLFESRNTLFFIFGLACFLTTHVFYIIYFLNIRSAGVSLLKKNPVLVLLVIGYGMALVWLLLPHLGKLKIPVMVYAAVICLMLICCLHAYSKTDKTAANAFLLGALSFVLSDSLLAINKFYQLFAFAGAFIMLSYCAAQFFIVRGFMKQNG